MSGRSCSLGAALAALAWSPLSAQHARPPGTSTPVVARSLSAPRADSARADSLRGDARNESVRRIAVSDLSVPVWREPYWYYARTEDGKQYPVFARRKRSLTAKEEVVFDLNKEAAGARSLSLGAFEVSPDHSKLAVLVDTTGEEAFELRVRDLISGRDTFERLRGLSVGLAWANDNRTIFYVKPDSAKRGHQVWRHWINSDPILDALVHHEPDARFDAGVSRTRSGAYIVVGSRSGTCSEWYVIPAARPATRPKLIAKRQPNVEYSVDHAQTKFVIRTNGGSRRSFAIMQAPLTAPVKASWKPLVPYADSVFVEGVDAFDGFLLVTQRVGGKRQLVVRDANGARPRVIPTDEAVYEIVPVSNLSFRTPTIRYQYSSAATPLTIYEYNVRTGARKVLKRDEVLGGGSDGSQ